MALTWTDPILLTREDPFSDTSDESSIPEADVAYLGGGVAVVGLFSGDSYILRLWAINTRGAVPDVGPVSYSFGFGVGSLLGFDDNSWIDPPVPEDPPYFDALNDLSFIIPTGGSTFAIIGQANASFDADGNQDGTGNYFHAASFYAVDVNTLEITRTQVCFVDFTLFTFSNQPQVVTGAAWGSSVVIVLGAMGDVMIAHPDGSVTVFAAGITDTTMGAPIVVGDTAYFLAAGDGTGAREYSINLNTGSVTNGGLVGTGAANYVWFGALRPDGKLVWTVNGLDDYSTYTPVKLAIDTPGSYDPAIFPVADSARSVGWEFDWYGNDRSIGVWDNNSCILGYTALGGQMSYAVVDEDGSVIDTGPVANLTLGGHNPQTERLCALDQGRAAAVQVRQVHVGDITYGLRFTMVAALHITGQLDDTRVRFL